MLTFPKLKREKFTSNILRTNCRSLYHISIFKSQELHRTHLEYSIVNRECNAMIGEPVLLVKIARLLKHNNSSVPSSSQNRPVQFDPARLASITQLRSQHGVTLNSFCPRLSSPLHPQCPAPVARVSSTVNFCFARTCTQTFLS